MSGKSLGWSIFAMIFFIGLLVGVVYLFMIYWLLGIVGVILLAIFPRMFFAKAVDAANGPLDTLIAKFVAPILSAVIALLILLTLFLWV